MATFPAYAKLTADGFGETILPGIRKTEMEKGPVKMAIISSRVTTEIPCTVLFTSAKDAAAFETWYLSEIKRVGYFDVIHPRTGQKISARIKDADIGTLTRVSPRWAASYRSLTLEYQR